MRRPPRNLHCHSALPQFITHQGRHTTRSQRSTTLCPTQSQTTDSSPTKTVVAPFSVSSSLPRKRAPWMKVTSTSFYLPVIVARSKSNLSREARAQRSTYNDCSTVPPGIYRPPLPPTFRRAIHRSRLQVIRKIKRFWTLVS